jgi:quercetin dioxygenase-like cupin family protein
MSFAPVQGLISTGCVNAPTFDIRTVALEPGGTLPYDEAEWRDALVTVESGEVELEMTCGRSCFFGQGDLIWLEGLPLARLHNRGDEPTVLVAASRTRELR